MITEEEAKEFEIAMKQLIEDAGGIVCWTEGCCQQALDDSDFCFRCDARAGESE